MDSLAHWDGIYRTKGPSELSWQQDEPRLSLELIGQVAPARDAAILDVGGGASRLVDALVARGYTNLTVLDLAPSALELTRARLGAAGEAVHWLAADVCTVPLPPNVFDVWHDRAVSHFLTTPPARAAYLAQVRHALKPGGHVVVATFAEDGPTRCSGLDVARYSAEQLHAAFGADFALVTSMRELHATPWGARQAFTYCLLQYQPASREPLAA